MLTDHEKQVLQEAEQIVRKNSDNANLSDEMFVNYLKTKVALTGENLMFQDNNDESRSDESLKTKVEAYNDLIKEVWKCGYEQKCNIEGKGIKLYPTYDPNMNEINKWAYWQGGRSHLNANILLLGQDFGKDIGLIDTSTHYLKGTTSSTDLRLIKLFRILGYEVGPDVIGSEDKLEELFFTNFVLCYRHPDSSDTGNLSSRWMTNCSGFIKKLIEIIEPRIIICLGQETYKKTERLFHDAKEIEKESFNDCINNYDFYDQRHFTMNYVDGTHGVIVPASHTGNLGTNNRKGKIFSGEKAMEQDWTRIKEYIEELKKQGVWKFIKTTEDLEENKERKE